jgi:hypothetical protein
MSPASNVVENAGALVKPQPTKIMGTCCFANLEISEYARICEQGAVPPAERGLWAQRALHLTKTQGARRRVLEHN